MNYYHSAGVIPPSAGVAGEPSQGALYYPTTNQFQHIQPLNIAGSGSPASFGYRPVAARPAVTVPTVPIIEPVDGGEHRVARDGSWVIAFGSIVLLGAVLAVVSAVSATPAILHRGVNFNGLVCGVDHQVVSFPYLLYPLSPASAGTPHLLINDPQCVKTCPGISDVGRAIDVPMALTEKDPEGGSSVVIQYRVKSPLYATKLVANSICLPTDSTLRAEVLRQNHSISRQMAFAVGTMLHAWPAYITACLVALVAAVPVFFGMFRFVPRIVGPLASCFLQTALYGSGVYALWWGFKGIYQLPELYAKFFPTTIITTIIAGILLLMCAVVASVFTLANWGVMEVASRALYAVSEVVWDLKHLFVFSVVLAAVSCGFLMVWLKVLVNLVSSAPISAYQETLALNENGGLAILPLHRDVQFMSPAIIAGLLVWLVVLLWTLGVLSHMNKFVAAYVGASWYFSAPLHCGCDERDTGFLPAVVGVDVGVRYHLGSLALGSLVQDPLRPVRALFSFATERLVPHLVGGDHRNVVPAIPIVDNGVTLCLAKMAEPVLPALSRIADRIQSAIYVEMALHPFAFRKAEQVMLSRLQGHGPLLRPCVATPYIGTAATLSFVTTAAISVLVGWMTFITVGARSEFAYREAARESGLPIRTSVDYSAPDSPYFVSTPLIPAIIAGTLASILCGFIADAWEVLVDAMFYCYVLEVEGVGDDSHLTAAGTRIGEVDEHPCNLKFAPTGVKDLILEALDLEVYEDYVNNGRGYY